MDRNEDAPSDRPSGTTKKPCRPTYKSYITWTQDEKDKMMEILVDKSEKYAELTKDIPLPISFDDKWAYKHHAHCAIMRLRPHEDRRFYREHDAGFQGAMTGRAAEIWNRLEAVRKPGDKCEWEVLMNRLDIKLTPEDIMIWKWFGPMYQSQVLRVRPTKSPHPPDKKSTYFEIGRNKRVGSGAAGGAASFASVLNDSGSGAGPVSLAPVIDDRAGVGGKLDAAGAMKYAKILMELSHRGAGSGGGNGSDDDASDIE
jgi:hypothetical protein